MDIIYLLLLLAGFVCFLIAAFAPAQTADVARRVQFGWLGLACWILVPLIEQFRALD